MSWFHNNFRKVISKRTPRSILVIPDTHIPYEHRDALAFLTKVKKQYNPDLVIHIGDVADFHAMSMHDHYPDLPSPAEELRLAQEKLKDWVKLFPNLNICLGNHDELPIRRARKCGIPTEMVKDLSTILQLPKTWSFHPEYRVGEIMFVHGLSSVVGKLSKNRGLSIVQGHYHTKFYIFHWSSPDKLFFDMGTGCLIDDRKLAFLYNKRHVERPVLGCSVIINNVPKLIPMMLKRGGRWDKTQEV